MKLYTIDQLRYIYECYGYNLDQDGCFEIDSNEHFKQCIETLKPIEIPSDEEIKNMDLGSGMHYFYKGGFIEGAIWMKEQILNQNK